MDHVIRYDETTTVRRDYPDDWLPTYALDGGGDPIVPAFTVTLYDAAGTSLDTGAADCGGWYATTVAAPRGARVLTASAVDVAVTVAWAAGDRILLYSTTGGAHELAEIESASNAAGTWTLNLRERLENTHPIGVRILPWWCSYDVDTTVVATWTLGRRGTIRWTPTAIFDTYSDFVDTWDLRSALRDLTGVERMFRALFPRMAEVLRDQVDFSILIDDAESWVRAQFASTAIDFDSLVSQDALKRLLVRHIAWTVAGQGGEELAGEFERIGTMRADALATFEKQIHAQDPNQDNIVEEPDDYVVGEPAPFRVW